MDFDEEVALAHSLWVGDQFAVGLLLYLFLDV